MYYDTYQARGNDKSEIIRLAKSRGFDNAGPIVAFPLNKARFGLAGSARDLEPGAIVLVPWHPNLLRKLIATEEHLANEVAKSARAMITEEHQTKEQLEQFLLLVDAACMLANVGKGVGELVVHGVKHGEMTAGLMVSWFVTSRIELASDIATLTIPAPSQPKKDFKFFVRHTLGPWTPSFWAAAWVAYKSGDIATYLYGPAATEYQTRLRIRNQAEADISRLLVKVRDAKQQLAMPFNWVRI